MIGACVTPLVTGLEIPEQSSEDNEKVKENTNWDEIKGVYFDCDVDITFNHGVSNWLIRLWMVPVPFDLYIYFAADSMPDETDVGHVEIKCSDGTSVEFDSCAWITFVFFGFIGLNTLDQLYDLDGGRVTGYAAVAYFDIR